MIIGVRCRARHVYRERHVGDRGERQDWRQNVGHGEHIGNLSRGRGNIMRPGPHSRFPGKMQVTFLRLIE